jgi:hypothetical protein
MNPIDLQPIDTTTSLPSILPGARSRGPRSGMPCRYLAGVLTRFCPLLLSRHRVKIRR